MATAKKKPQPRERTIFEVITKLKELIAGHPQLIGLSSFLDRLKHNAQYTAPECQVDRWDELVRQLELFHGAMTTAGVSSKVQKVMSGK